MTEISKGMVIFRKYDGKIQYLLIQTNFGMHHWTAPKGHAKPGETELETALRKTRKECGLRKDDLEIFMDSKRDSDYKSLNTPKTVTYWLAELVNLNASIYLDDKHQDYRWFTIEEACQRSLKELGELLLFMDGYIKNNLLGH